MTTTLDIYREQRELVLAKIANELASGEHFAAGWLTGSYARNEADPFSDIDISIAVADAYSEVLCRRLEQVSSQTSPERYSLFSQFGTPAVIHENNNNAPEAGTFTFVLYAESAIMIDWTLIPQSRAKRPVESILLFDKVKLPGFPALEPETLERSKRAVAEIRAFFWMMTAITIKYIHREDDVFTVSWIESLHHLVNEIERHLDRKPLQYTRGSLSSLHTGREEQLESIKELCNQTLGLKERVSQFIDTEPLTPMTEIENLFQLCKVRPINLKSQIRNRKSACPPSISPA